jgi:hypothetical protein
MHVPLAVFIVTCPVIGAYHPENTAFQPVHWRMFRICCLAVDLHATICFLNVMILNLKFEIQFNLCADYVVHWYIFTSLMPLMMAK